MTTELNNLRENVNYIELKSFTNKSRWEKTTGMDTVSFEKKAEKFKSTFEKIRKTYWTYLV